jgi:hypothetical protein
MAWQARAIGLACAAYTCVAVAYTWPLAVRLGGVPHDLGDPLLTTWFLWWSGSQAVPLSAAWWNAPFFHPAAGVFGLSEHLLGLAPIAAPLIALTGQPLVGHNVAFIATFVLSALGAHFLAYTLTRRHDVSTIAAVAFAFAPYRLPQTPHIQVLASFWTPVCLGALNRYDQTGRAGWAAAASAAWVLQGLTCGYYLFFLWLLAAFWILWFGVGRWPLRRLGVVTDAFAAGAVVLAPFLRGYQFILRETYGFHRSIGEIRAFSADIASLLSASEDLLLWGWVRVIERPESNLFPGLTIVLLSALALSRARPFDAGIAESIGVRRTRRVLTALLVLLLLASILPLAYGTWQLTIGGTRLVSISRADKPLTLALVVALGLVALLPGVRSAFQRRSPLAFYAFAATATWIFALGPDPSFMDQRALYRAPYSWLMLLPGFDGLRVPARFWMMTLACLSVVAALAVHRLQGTRRNAVAALAVAGLLIDGWPRRFPVLAAPDQRPSPQGVATRIDLPVDDFADARALYRQTFHRTALYNGFSGYTPPHYPAMRAMLDAGDARILPVLAAGGSLGVVIDHAMDVDGSLRKFVLGAPGATLDRMEPEWSSYRVPQHVESTGVPEPSGNPVAIKSARSSGGTTPPEAAIDGRMETRWNGGPQRAPAELGLELQEAARVAQLVMRLGPYGSDFPVRLRLDVSADGTQWETVFDGDTLLHTYYGAVRHPRDVPVVIPVDRNNVRFIRLQQTGSGKYDWSIAEIQVLR